MLKDDSLKHLDSELSANITPTVTKASVTRFLAQYTSQNAILTPLFKLACMLLGGYGIFLLAARSFFDNAINFDTRILSPGYIAAMMIMVSIVTHWLKTKIFGSQSASRLVFYLLVIVISVAQTTAGVAWWRLSYIDGIGFAGPSWRNSELVKFVNNVQSSTVVFTNVPDILYMLTGRLTAMIPSKNDPKSGLPNKQYQLEISAMNEQLRTTGGAVVYFHTEQRLRYLPSEDALRRDAGLSLVVTTRDGYIYRLE